MTQLVVPIVADTNTVDDGIKWITEGEVVTKTPLDGHAMVGEDMSIRVE